MTKEKFAKECMSFYISRNNEQYDIEVGFGAGLVEKLRCDDWDGMRIKGKVLIPINSVFTDYWHERFFSLAVEERRCPDEQAYHRARHRSVVKKIKKYISLLKDLRIITILELGRPHIVFNEKTYQSFLEEVLDGPL